MCVCGAVVGRCRDRGPLGSCWQYLITVLRASAGNGEMVCWSMTVLRKSGTKFRSAISGTSSWVFRTYLGNESRTKTGARSKYRTPFSAQMSNLCSLFGFFGSRYEILKGAINAVSCRIFRPFVTDRLARGCCELTRLASRFIALQACLRSPSIVFLAPAAARAGSTPALFATSQLHFLEDSR